MRRYLTLVICSLLLCTSALAAENLLRTVEETKALYTVRIAEYATWPNSTITQGAAGPQAAGVTPFVIGIVGRDPNGVIGIIRNNIDGAKPMKIKGRNVELVQIRSIDPSELSTITAALDQCDLLFFSQDSEAEWRRLKPMLQSRPIVTVSEFPDFAEQGGIVEYHFDKEYRFDKSVQRVYMIFNMQALKEAGVAVSARLLNLKVSRLVNEVSAP